MNVLMCGGMGFVGFNLSQYLSMRNHTVVIVDNLLRERLVKEDGASSIIPVPTSSERLRSFHREYGYHPEYYEYDAGNYEDMKRVVTRFKPDCIVQFAEIPSAPWSMGGFNRAWFTTENNLKSTLSLIYCIRR